MCGISLYVYAILSVYLTEIILSQIHDLLRCTGALDGEGWHGKDGITTLEIFDKLKRFCNIFWGEI